MLIIIISIILSVAYLTLLERKVLGVIQRRMGPNIVGIYGIFQPLIDGVKLLLKENIIPINIRLFQHIIPSVIVFIISLLLFIFLVYNNNIILINNNYSILYIFAISTLSIYGVLLGGYYSKSKYSLIGALRATSQLISYEVSIGFIIINNILINNTLDIYEIYYNTIYIYNYIIIFISFILMFISVLAETNRTPFDLLEAESELVAGFLVEYSSITFVLYYLSEYTMILFWSLFIDILYNINYIIILFLFIIIRATLPRLKYNQLLILGWLYILPFSIVNYLIYYSIYFLFNYV